MDEEYVFHRDDGRLHRAGCDCGKDERTQRLMEGRGAESLEVKRLPSGLVVPIGDDDLTTGQYL